MIVKRIKLVGTEPDESVSIFEGGFFVARIYLWNGMTNVLKTQGGSDFAHFPIDIYENLVGLRITHVTISARRGNITTMHVGFVEFQDVNDVKRLVPIPFGEINGIIFGALLLSSFKVPFIVPLPQKLMDELFTVPAIIAT